MSDTPGSRILYHYTDNAGLVGILDKGVLWFSDPRLLNDAQELKIAIEVGDFTIHECVNENRQIWKDAGISESRFDHFVTTVRSIIRHNSHGFEVMSPPTP